MGGLGKDDHPDPPSTMAAVEERHLASTLRQCAGSKDLEAGRRTHRQMPTELRSSTYLGNLVVNMYGKCGSVAEAKAAFDAIGLKNIQSWTILLAAYTQNGQCRAALRVSLEMHLEGLKPDAFTLSTLASACMDLSEARAIHAQAQAAGMLDVSNVVVGNSIVGLYARCGRLDEALGLFNKMAERDVIAWNTVLSALARNGHCREALQLFNKMLQEGQEPDDKTFISVIGACSRLRSLEQGKRIHSFVLLSGFMSVIMVANTLLNMYGKCGSFEEAASLLDSMVGRRTTGTWNTLITAYAKAGQGRKALRLFFHQMDVEPDYVTFVNLVTACISLGSVDDGRRVHKCIAARGLDKHLVVGNALVNMYGKTDLLEDARAAFEAIELKDRISWNSLISAYARHGHGSQAIELFRKMEQDGIKPDMSTFTSILDACAMVEDLDQGQQIHQRIAVGGSDEVVKTALVNLYGKCGRLEQASGIFSSMRSTDIVSWNAMMAVYSQRGHSDGVLGLFWDLLLEGLYPDEATFITVLSACSHAGYFADGWSYFVSLVSDYYDLQPSPPHYRCMVDLLARAGQLGKAEEMIQRLPLDASSRMAWMSLLAASQVQENVPSGLMAATKIFDMDPANSSAYVVLSNMYMQQPG